MSRAKIPVCDKVRLVRAHLAHEDYVMLADQLSINRSTARGIVSRAMRTNDPENVIDGRRGGAIRVKVDEEMKEAIRDILGSNPAITLRNLSTELQRQLPHKPSVTPQHLGKICNGMFFSLKKLQSAPADRNRADVKEDRKIYASWFLETALCSPRVVYIDESGFNVWTQRTRGRAPIGECAVRTVHGQRGENMTIILAISPQRGVEHHQFLVGGTTAAAFQSFYDELCEKVGGGNSCIFILDNAPCHRSVQNRYPDNHTIRFLPPYSPMLTPIENAFSAWKWSIKNSLASPDMQLRFSDRQMARNSGMTMCQWRRHFLQSSGEEAVSVVTQEKCRSWQEHCISYFSKCWAKEDIFT